MDDQAPAWDISAPSTYICTIDRQGKRLTKEILPVARKGQLKGQHRGLDHVSKGTGPEIQNHGGRSYHSQ